MTPIISIVGRPNVGKSTLFNRMIGYRKAITEDTPGVTRDRNYSEFEYDGKTFVLVDTGGFEPTMEDGYFPLIKKQIQVSMEESSIILFVLDGREGLTPQDKEIARILRRYEKPVFFVINKVDSQKGELPATEFYELGIEQYYTISALHGTGIVEVLEGICDASGGIAQREEEREQSAKRKDQTTKTEEGQEIRVAIVGRPNTGKSSLTNRLLGSERMIVSDVPGTTRDAIDSEIWYKEKPITLIDTAGLRRKSRISMKIEEYSISSAIRSIERADVVNLVIDAQEGASHQDAGIAHLIISRGKGLCIVVNKWDLLEGKMKEGEGRELVKERIPHAAHAPVVFVSAKTGKNVESIVETDLKIYSQLKRRISTAKLNAIFGEFFTKLSISRQKGKEVKIFYVHQAKTTPPTFILFANNPELVPEHYKRYLENSLREKYGFHGAPIRLIFKRK